MDKVWIVESGEYCRPGHLMGIFSSKEKAMAKALSFRQDKGHALSGKWRHVNSSENGSEEWDNQGDRLSVYPEEVQ